MLTSRTLLVEKEAPNSSRSLQAPVVSAHLVTLVVIYKGSFSQGGHLLGAAHIQARQAWF